VVNCFVYRLVLSNIYPFATAEVHYTELVRKQRTSENGSSKWSSNVTLCRRLTRLV